MSEWDGLLHLDSLSVQGRLQQECAMQSVLVCARHCWPPIRTSWDSHLGGVLKSFVSGKGLVDWPFLEHGNLQAYASAADLLLPKRLQVIDGLTVPRT